jgi:hypothetical protein
MGLCANNLTPSGCRTPSRLARGPGAAGAANSQLPAGSCPLHARSGGESESPGDILGNWHACPDLWHSISAPCDPQPALAAEVAALEADDDDRREMIEIAEFMESMRAAGCHTRISPAGGLWPRAAWPPMPSDRSGRRAAASLGSSRRAHLAQRQASVVPPGDRPAG